jgi:hypothetical protein
VAGVLHAGAAQRRQLRRPPLPRPALPHQHRLRPHLRQSRCCTRSPASSTATCVHYRMLRSLQLLRHASAASTPMCTESSHSVHCSMTRHGPGLRAGRGQAVAAAAGAVRHHRRHPLLQPEAPRQRHDQGLPLLLRCFRPTRCVHLAVFRAAQRRFACHTHVVAPEHCGSGRRPQTLTLSVEPSRPRRAERRDGGGGGDTAGRPGAQH